MQKKIQSALISVFYKDGLAPLVQQLHEQNVTIYSTGGTQKFIEQQGIACVPVENLTHFPSILGGRVKTLHPCVFGGILARRDNEQDLAEMKEFKIPEIDLVIVDLYPFEQTLKQTSEEKLIIEKIDIGGPSMIRAAGKNYKDLVVISDKADYAGLVDLLKAQQGATTLEQRRSYAAKAFEVAMNYDIAINNFFNGTILQTLNDKQVMRYGENPHQQGSFYGNLDEVFEQLNGKALSYNNLVDVDGAVQLALEFKEEKEPVFAIFKHTNVCGIAIRPTLKQAWDAALAGDPESAFGGVIITNKTVDKATADGISEIFFEVLIAPAFEPEALEILKAKKNRIILQIKPDAPLAKTSFKSILNGTLVQDIDKGNFDKWEEVGGRECTQEEKENLAFANLVCKHLKSNAIALIKNKQLVGKGCGQTSRVDALRHSIEKAKQFDFDLHGAVLASDAFFPFDDCVKLAHAEGIEAIIQPGGSIRDKDSIAYCKENNLAMVLTGQRHFRH
ncbi:bifunctional phosphoribosylaminoimidazolecarboxamide formyltransferase/IMP cyclohydrolase [Arachidicoccus ginsenosidivorans]|jgi:phosphoribosylaminoimidazolecarboxamide formyltransferase/IMP cyclohydrolase|uniref:Bifunctional purine biosynthesis protein PurH n=1 Tax=Arachidicoccus ginsenosidivorans TaxID=496057 RepID=A0A5B8VGA2_9BACT|nr:bifunctional phosphoribosylaminoimidazolecarboxamide formyltransferase/IMP cyclohydrolase [Arachidicoccus ginsenosidivorans]QEC70500.1 bifunctional phosphoribosylaminoimidazolecarboxamide formyltransferase/IMP cyclohydrolase [Arachidicoccus ginsenosidivorans]